MGRGCHLRYLYTNVPAYFRCVCVCQILSTMTKVLQKNGYNFEFSDKELLRQINLHQEAPQQPEETAISVASASNNCQPYKGDPFLACSMFIEALGLA